jgi:hypothetical protein
MLIRNNQQMATYRLVSNLTTKARLSMSRSMQGEGSIYFLKN